MKRPERPSAKPAAPPAKSAPTPKVTPRAAATPTPTPRTQQRPAADRRAPHPAKPPAPERRARRIRKRSERAEVNRFTRRRRNRRLAWLGVFGVLAIVAALIATAVFSPILALREIRVDGTERLDPAVLQHAVEGQLGTPLALVDEDRLRRDLSQFTGIRSYATELVPPGTLVIHIVERSPLGAVLSPTGFDIVDAAGVVLESTPTRPEALPLLQIDDEGPEGTGFAAMAEVLVALPPGVLAQIDSIAARTRDDVTLTLTGSTQRVVWGSADDSDRKARILDALLARFASAGPGEYDVSAPGSAVFRLD
ncbi:cell division protein FtsQ/DivIB [Pseudolysinimonas sp.]|uniref:cell division protein FtsQ/DivIB n=1 Tax=Pseudolysinimonas sp. TaxID=2680009 RepID=UPI0037841BA1